MKERCLKFFCPIYFLLLWSLHDLTIFHVKLKSCTHAIRENWNDLRVKKLTIQKVIFDRKKTTCQACRIKSVQNA